MASTAFVLAAALVLALGSHLQAADGDGSPDPHHALMEQFWTKCRKELNEINGIVKVHLTEDVHGDPSYAYRNTMLLAKDHILRAVNHLSPQTKHAIYDCFRKHNFPIQVIREDGHPGSWCMEYIEFLIHLNPSYRRFLAEQTIQVMSSHFSSADPTEIAAFQSSAPATPLNTPILTPSLPEDPNPNDSPFPHVQEESTPVPAGQKSNHPAEGKEPKNQSKHGKESPKTSTSSREDSMKPMLIAIVLTGIASFIVAACVFLYYDKCCRSDRMDSFRKDERPLLTLSLSDFSGGSSKSYGFGSSSHNDKNGSSTYDKSGSSIFDKNGSSIFDRTGSSIFDKELSIFASDKDGTMSFKGDPASNGHLSPLDVSSNEIQPSAAAPEGMSNPPVVPPSSPLKSAPKPSAPLPPPPAAPPPPAPAKKVPPSGAPPPPPPKPGAGPRAPPPPKGSAPRPPQPGAGPRKSPLGPKGSSQDSDGDPSKTKLKPFFWDKVLANPDQSMVWHQISSGSFQFNEEMIESLFGCAVVDNKQKGPGKKSSSSAGAVQQVQLLDPKKSQNLAILLRALNVTTEEVCEALMEGNELPSELLQTLLKMAPTAEEELKLRLYNGDSSQIGTAERFLKALVEIPFAFKRLDALLYMGSLQEEMSSVKESFGTLEIACTELRSSRLFLKLLEAVLKTGNRMNNGTYRGGAQAFKLDTLLKLSDVKGTDGKTTLLHFVVQEIIRSEGMKAARIARESGSFSAFSFNSVDLVIDDSPLDSGDHVRNLGLNVVLGLGNELENVKKAAALDADVITNTVAILGHGLVKMKEFLNKDMKGIDEDSEFHRSLECFVEHAEKDITSLLEDEKRIRALVKSTTDYFHGNAGKDEGLRLFVIVRDFLGMIEKVCNEVRQASAKKVQKPPSNKEGQQAQQPVQDPRRLLFPAIAERRAERSDSDDDSP